MNTGRNERHSLDSLLSGIEDEVLRIDDLALLSEDESMFASVEDVRALIQFRIDECVSIKHSESDTDMGRISSKLKNRDSEAFPISVPKGAVERRQLLEMIIASQSNLPRQVGMAFSASEKPSESAMDDMVAQLVRLGILKTTDSDD